MNPLGKMDNEALREHRHLEYLRAAGSVQRKRGHKKNGKQIGRARDRWKKFRQVH